MHDDAATESAAASTNIASRHTSYLHCAGQRFEDSLLLDIDKKDFAILLHCGKNVGTSWVPCEEQECTLFELRSRRSFACPHIPHPAQTIQDVRLHGRP